MGTAMISLAVDDSVALARLNSALALMQEQVSLLKAMAVVRSNVAQRARAAQLGTELRQYVQEMDAIHAYCGSKFRDVSMLTQDEVLAIARQAGWLS